MPIAIANKIDPRDAHGVLIQKGMSVRIKKGTSISGTFPTRTKTAKTSHVVKVHAAYNGWPRISDHRDDGPRTPRISWAGTGGYWHNCDAADVVVV